MSKNLPDPAKDPQLAGIDLTLKKGNFVHCLKCEGEAACGEDAPPGGFTIVPAQEFLDHPCPDCLSKLKREGKA